MVYKRCQLFILSFPILCTLATALGISRQGTQYCPDGQLGDRFCGGYMCIDWTFGSERMAIAQAAYAPTTIFAVGAYGGSGNLGKCFEFTPNGSGYKFVFQVTNHGFDVKEGAFDIQTGAGGFGLFNACTMGTIEGTGPMFPEGASAFGEICGGIQTEAGCSTAPLGLQELCTRAFQWGGRNLQVSAIKRMRCPSHLYEITGLRLLSDDEIFDEEFRSSGYTTTMMDCCRPSASYRCDENGNQRIPDADPNYPYVLQCDQSGYNRVARVAGCN